MSHNKAKQLTPYAIASCFILTWWCLAFSHTVSVQFTQVKPSHALPSNRLPSLSQLNRNSLQEALSGNFTLMAKLIADWDLDARLMTQMGYSTTQSLPPERLFRSQLLARELSAKPSPKTDSRRLLPQTYVAASILLALAPPEQITALPAGMRKQTTLFPKELTDKIPIDANNRIQNELLFLAHPDMALVSNYSDPSMLETLKKQGVTLNFLPPLNNLNDIFLTLKEIGKQANRIQESELLELFIASALIAIDNRIQLLNIQEHLPQILFLTYRNHFSIPTEKLLTGQLLKRLGIANALSERASPHDWSVPIECEDLMQLNPHCVIISAPQHHDSILSASAFTHIEAYRNRNIFFVDQEVQDFYSQYLVLAYYDLFHAIASAEFS